MRSVITGLIVVALAGCGVEVLTTAAIQGEATSQQLKAMKRQVKGAADTTAQINIRRAIDTHYAEKSAYPLTLEALVPDYLPRLPKQPDGTPYAYDPTTGQLLDVPPLPEDEMAEPTLSDRDKAAMLRKAVDRYAHATQYYPSSLQTLVPTFIEAVPTTASGQEFEYDVQTGVVLLPRPTATGYAAAPPPPRHPAGPPPPPHPGGPRPARRPGPVGAGAGPMGEVMTGMAIQQELGNQSSAGVNSAGSYSRGKLGSTTQQHNKRQQEALDALGQ